MAPSHHDAQRIGQFRRPGSLSNEGGQQDASRTQQRETKVQGDSQFRLPGIVGQDNASSMQAPVTGSHTAPQLPSWLMDGQNVAQLPSWLNNDQSISQVPSWLTDDQQPSQAPSWLTDSQPVAQSQAHLTERQPPAQAPSWLTDSQPIAQAPSWLTDSQPSAQAPSWLAESQPAAVSSWITDSQPVAQAPSWLTDSQPVEQPQAWHTDSYSIAQAPGWVADSQAMPVQGPVTDQQGAMYPPYADTGSQWAFFEMTGSQEVPVQYVTMGSQSIPLQAVIDSQSLAVPYVTTGSQSVPLSVAYVTGAQSVPLPVPPLIEEEEIEAPGGERMAPLVAVLVNVALVALIVWVQNTGAFLGWRSSFWAGNLNRSANDITNNKEISPLIFGTNLALFHDDDEPALNSPVTRQMLKNIGVRVIRMPTRATLKDDTEIAAANAIKAVGAVPLIVISGPEYKDGDILENDQHLLSMFSGVFGDQTVYYEFGNESDLNGVKVEGYIDIWNRVMPRLKQEFPHARFLGPDNYQFTRRYLKTFLQKAQPRPDGVSWHEYTCSVTWSADFCLANLETWPTHFAQARAAMREAIGTELPIWITEWNYASDQALNNGQPINDGKFNNPTFIKTWTTKALETLAENRIFASMQYFSTDPPMPLISHEKLATEGELFQQAYQKIMVDGYTPPVAQFKPLAAQVGKHPVFSFEDAKALDGWNTVGTGITTPIVTTAQALDGTHSLQITLSNTSEDDTPFISVAADRLPAPLKPGQMITANLLVANKNALVNAKLYVGDVNHNWYFANDLTLTSGTWNRLWYAVPMNFAAQVNEIGIQFYTAKPGVSSDVYIDAISIN